MKRLAIAAVLSITTAFLASGCLWGVVSDSETGAPLAGAKVRVLDSDGDGFEATTDSYGIYVFDVREGPIPAFGPAKFAIWLYGCDLAKHWVNRVLEYDDNPAAENPLDSWEIQHLSTCHYYATATPAPVLPPPELVPVPTATPTFVALPLPRPIKTPIPPPR